MPRGRPPLRIGAHGKITRKYLGGGVWMTRCRYRDSDGVTRRVAAARPADEHDQHGKLAEDALIEASGSSDVPDGDEITLDTKDHDPGRSAHRPSGRRWPFGQDDRHV